MSSNNKQGLFDALGRASIMGLHMVSGVIVGRLPGTGWTNGSAPRRVRGASGSSWAWARDSGTYGWTPRYCCVRGAGRCQEETTGIAAFHAGKGSLAARRSGLLSGKSSAGSSPSPICLIGGGLLWFLHPLGRWLFWFGFGALLSAWNLRAHKVRSQSYLRRLEQKNLIALLVHTNMRLLFTGILLYMALVPSKGSISAVLSALWCSSA